MGEVFIGVGKGSFHAKSGAFEVKLAVGSVAM